jgi:hypothetical protein
VVTATAQPFSVFTGWSGACSGTSPECRIVMTQSRDVRAAFSGSGVPNYTLNISGSGTGSGTVQSQGGLTCHQLPWRRGSGCSSPQSPSTSPAVEGTTGWGGDCDSRSLWATVASANFSVPLGRGHGWPVGPQSLHSGDAYSAAQREGPVWGHTGEPQLWNGLRAASSRSGNTCWWDDLRLSVQACLLSGNRLLVAGGQRALGDLRHQQASIFRWRCGRRPIRWPVRWYPR